MKRGKTGVWDDSFDVVERNVGANVQRIRQDSGQTQAALAEKVGIEIKTLQRIESGKGNVTARLLMGLALWLGVKPGEMFEPCELRPRPRGRPRKVVR